MPRPSKGLTGRTTEKRPKKVGQSERGVWLDRRIFQSRSGAGTCGTVSYNRPATQQNLVFDLLKSCLCVCVYILKMTTSSPMRSNRPVPGPSNRSPLATFKSTKASRGDLLEGAGMGRQIWSLSTAQTARPHSHSGGFLPPSPPSPTGRRRQCGVS